MVSPEMSLQTPGCVYVNNLDKDWDTQAAGHVYSSCQQLDVDFWDFGIRGCFYIHLPNQTSIDLSLFPVRDDFVLSQTSGPCQQDWLKPEVKWTLIKVGVRRK